jgi:hypothetical protein
MAVFQEWNCQGRCIKARMKQTKFITGTRGYWEALIAMDIRLHTLLSARRVYVFAQGTIVEYCCLSDIEQIHGIYEAEFTRFKAHTKTRPLRRIVRRVLSSR